MPRALSALRSRLDKLALAQLREVAAAQADRIEQLERDLQCARDDAIAADARADAAINDAMDDGHEFGLTQDGQVMHLQSSSAGRAS